MTSTFGRVRSGEDIYGAVTEAARDGYQGLLTFKDGRPSIQGGICLNDRYHPGKDFGVVVKGDVVNGTVVGLDYDEVESIALGGPFGPPPDPQFSPDGKPFYNGYCWQESGDIVEHLGTCTNPACLDPKLDERPPDPNRPRGYYCGASIKSMTCPGCGHPVPLT